jgi:CRP/FNR family transcriptional regulator
MFLLVEGAIKLVQRTGSSRERVVELVRPGDWFAESAVFCGNGYHASARALSHTEVLGVPAVALGRFLKQRPGLAVGLLHRLSRRAETAVQQMSDLCTRTAEQRVAAYLLEYDEGEGSAYRVPDGPHSRADLASFLAVTPETLSRILQRFRRLGLIEKVGTELLIRQPESLAGMSCAQPPN